MPHQLLVLAPFGGTLAAVGEYPSQSPSGELSWRDRPIASDSSLVAPVLSSEALGNLFPSRLAIDLFNFSFRRSPDQMPVIWITKPHPQVVRAVQLGLPVRPLGVESVLPVVGTTSSFTFPLSPMGQYFKAVNVTKREVICPWCLHSGSKLWEWSANPIGAVFTLLLRKSSASGGGDFGRPTESFNADNMSDEQVAESIARIALKEGQPAGIPTDSVVGRWAGDEVYLVGDYDSSHLYEESSGFRNISRELVPIWNHYIELKEMQLEYNPDCGCQESSDS